MIRGWLSLYRPSYVSTLVYMLQNTEYRVGPYLSWYWRTTDFGKVIKRRTLDPTRAAKLLNLALTTGMLLQIGIAVVLLVMGYNNHTIYGTPIGFFLLFSYPVVWAHLVVIPLFLGRLLIVGPRNRKLIKKARKIFADHPATKVAVAGSYGKTSMKEILLTVLSEGKKTAATPANKNVLSSHAHFAARLKGDEEILVIEYGEGKPGDIKRFTELSRPTIGIITGLAPAHLDQYKTLEAAAKDIFYLAEYLGDKPAYVNIESKGIKNYLRKNCISYSSEGTAGWKVSDIVIKPSGTKFTLKKNNTTLKLESGLMGKHQVGPLSAAAAIAYELGLTKAEIESGISKTEPFEHRMQPRNLHGAWVIDDTYNGNIEGIRAGLELLKAVEAKRKVYVTPGLVDQGREEKAVHAELGRLIKESKPDVVVLMSNSATEYILEGLGKDYKGELLLEHEPLKFYSNLDIFVAAGDVVLMQNDWTDNYK